MQLKHLYKDFDEEDDVGQRTMVATYRTRRASEFEGDRVAYERKQRKAATKRAPAIKLTDEEKVLMKKLGLTQAQVRALKAMQAEEET
jgi:hypothetical protein